MIELDRLLKELKMLMENAVEFSDVHFVHAYTGLPKASPLARPTVALSVKSMEEKDVEGVYSKVDEAAGQIPVLLYNHLVSVRLGVEIHVPQRADGIHCYELYTRLSRFMMDWEFSYDFVGVGCEDVRYERDRGAFVLSTYADIRQTSIVQ